MLLLRIFQLRDRLIEPGRSFAKIAGALAELLERALTSSDLQMRM